MNLSGSELGTLQYIVIGLAALVTLPFAVIWGLAVVMRGGSPLNVTITAFGMRLHVNTCPLNLTKHDCIMMHGRRSEDCSQRKSK